MTDLWWRKRLNCKTMRLNRRKTFLKDNSSKERFQTLGDALKGYNSACLEDMPDSANKIYQYYAYIDPLYIWLKNAYEDDLCVLCNEMRAILGHLSEYNSENVNSRRNLSKAYGHLRRLSIDTLKILCNGLDKAFDEWIDTHANYDYRSVDAEYFPKYVTLYNIAHNAYLQAQKEENLGSDRGNHIIEKYHTVAKKYYALYSYHMDVRRRRIEKITRRFKLNKILWIICTSLVVGLSVLGVVV